MSEAWNADRMTTQLKPNKPKKRANLIPIPNKKLFVLGFQPQRTINIVGYDVTYDHIPEYNLTQIYERFMRRKDEDEFDAFSFLGNASDIILKTLCREQTIQMPLPKHLSEKWKRVMGDTSPHFSIFCIPKSELGRLNPDDTTLQKLSKQWRQLDTELQHMLDERNMILLKSNFIK